MTELDTANELARRGEMEAACQAYRRIIESRDPDMAPRAHTALGRLLHEQGESEESNALLTIALRSGHARASAEAANQLAIQLAEAGDASGAQAMFQRAAECPEVAPHAIANIGVLLRQQGDLAGARAKWQEAVGWGTPDSLVWELHILQTYTDEGNWAAAREGYLKLAQYDDPRGREAYFHLNRITDFSIALDRPQVGPHPVRFRVEFDPCAAVWQTGDSGDARDNGISRPPSVYLGAIRPGHGNNPPRGIWRMVTAGTEHTVLVLGPQRSGKTAAVIIPNVLAWRGPVVSASVKTDVADATLAARARFGTCWYFDPSGTTPLGEVISPLRGLDIPTPPEIESLRWSPVASCHDWGEANRVAYAIVAAGETGEDRRETFWTERATALLGPLLHAAALARLSIREVARWARLATLQDALDILSAAAEEGDSGAEIAADTLRGLAGARELATHWSSVDGILRAYRDPYALAMADEPNFDATAFCRSNDTIYISAMGADQAAMAPIIVGFLRALSDALFAARLGYREPWMLWALDEMANIARIPDLDNLLSVAGGQHLLILGAIQDLSQARKRWGPEADGFLTLFHHKLVLNGIADTDTLQRLSRLAGEKEIVRKSTSTSAQFGTSETSSTERQPNLPEDALANPGERVAWRFTGARWTQEEGQVWIPPYYSTSPWHDMAIGATQYATCLKAAWAVAEVASRDLLALLTEIAESTFSQPKRLAVALYIAIVSDYVTLNMYAQAAGLTVGQATADFKSQYSNKQEPLVIPVSEPNFQGILGHRISSHDRPREQFHFTADTPLTWDDVVYMQVTLRYYGRRLPGTRFPNTTQEGGSDDRNSQMVIPIVEAATQQPHVAAKLEEAGPLTGQAVRHAALMLGADTMFADPAAVFP